MLKRGYAKTKAGFNYTADLRGKLRSFFFSRAPYECDCTHDICSGLLRGQAFG